MEYTNIFLYASIFLIVIFLASRVTTALYGAKFTLAYNDTYTLQVAFGALHGTREDRILETTRKVVVAEAEKFIAQSTDYNSYKIINCKRKLFPSAMVYTVRFE